MANKQSRLEINSKSRNGNTRTFWCRDII